MAPTQRSIRCNGWKLPHDVSSCSSAIKKIVLVQPLPTAERVSVLNSYNDVWRPNEHWTASCFGRICEGRTRAPSQHSLEQAESHASSLDLVTKVNQYCSSDLHVLKSKTWRHWHFPRYEDNFSGYFNFLGGIFRTFSRNFRKNISAILRDICG